MADRWKGYWMEYGIYVACLLVVRVDVWNRPMASFVWLRTESSASAVAKRGRYSYEYDVFIHHIGFDQWGSLCFHPGYVRPVCAQTKYFGLTQ